MGNVVTVWDVSNLSELVSAGSKPRDGDYNIQFSPNGKVFGINTNANLRLIDPQTGYQKVTLRKAISKRRGGWHFSSDGGYAIAEGNYDPLAIINTTVLPHPKMTRLPLHTSFVRSYAFNKENTVLALINDRQKPEIKLFKTQCGSLIRKLEIKDGSSDMPLAFNLEGLLAMAEEDFSLSMWEDPANGDLGSTLVRSTKLKRLGRRVISLGRCAWSADKVAFSPDGKTLASVWHSYSVIGLRLSATLCITTRGKTRSWSTMEIKLKKSSFGYFSALEVSDISVAVAWLCDVWVSVRGGPFHRITTDTIPVSLSFEENHRCIVIDGIEVELEGEVKEVIKHPGTLSIGVDSALSKRKSIFLGGKSLLLLPDEMKQISYERWGNCLALCPGDDCVVFIKMSSQ